MILKFLILLFYFEYSYCFQDGINIGILKKSGDEVSYRIIENVLRRELHNPVPILIQSTVHTLPEDEAIHYHEAICKFLKYGVVAIVTDTPPPFFPVLAGYSNAFHIPLISPILPEPLPDPRAHDLEAVQAVGIQPSTTRAMLDLIRYYGWQNIVYIYDEDHNAEKLQVMFRVGYTPLNLHLMGFLKTNSSEEANAYLQKLNIPGKQKAINVILDIDTRLAKEILLRHVHDIRLRKKNFHYFIAQPTLETFWDSHKTELGVLSITGFLYHYPDFNKFKGAKRDWLKISGNTGSDLKLHLNISNYYYHDAGLVLANALNLFRSATYNFRATMNIPALTSPNNCFELNGRIDKRFSRIMKQVRINDGFTGQLQFENAYESQGQRKNFTLSLARSSPSGMQEFGSWSDTVGLRITNFPQDKIPEVLPHISNRRKLVITTKISPPYVMMSKNGSELEGFCIDVMDTICDNLQVDCEVKLVEDGEYGNYVSSKGKWNGMIGEIIQGKADVAIADLAITGKRQRVVDFTDPFEMTSFSVVMKHPDMISADSPMFFVFKAFTGDVWICFLIALCLFCVLFHFMADYTGAPDSIDSASGIWGRKNSLLANLWFVFGSTLMQGTGIYPRSISTRILSLCWWFATVIFGSIFISSLVAQIYLINSQESKSPQLLKLKSLSLESIILESLTNGWPQVGIISPSYTSVFIKRSNLPLYRRYSEILDSNPDLLMSSVEEGLQRVRNSGGAFILVMESTAGEYASRQEPCDLVTTHDTYNFAGYGIATSLASAYRLYINSELNAMKSEGKLGLFHRKWWIESNECKAELKKTSSPTSIHAYSGMFILLAIGFCIILALFVALYLRKVRHNENRMQQLTFDDMNLEHRLPTPPPEMLAESTPSVPILNAPEIEKKRGPENFKDFFDRMRSDQ